MLFFSCKSDIEKVKEFSDIGNQPSVVAEGFEMLRSDSTVIRFKLIAPKLINQDEADPPYLEFPEGIHIEKFDAQMNITASIKADYAKGFLKEERWEAKNNVVAVNTKNGDTLKTEQLTWDEKKGKIYSNEFVEIINPERIITGIGLEADQDLTSWKIPNLKGTVYVDVEEDQQ